MPTVYSTLELPTKTESMTGARPFDPTASRPSVGTRPIFIGESGDRDKPDFVGMDRSWRSDPLSKRHPIHIAYDALNKDVAATGKSLEREVVEALKLTAISVEAPDPQAAPLGKPIVVVPAPLMNKTLIDLDNGAVEKEADAKVEQTTPLVGARPKDSATGARPREGHKPLVNEDDTDEQVTSKLNVEEPTTLEKGFAVTGTKAQRAEAATVAKQVSHDIDTAALRQQVVDKVQELAAMSGRHSVTIRLSPDDLGTITLAVSSLGENVEAKVTASNDVVRHALIGQRADLVQSIESRGLSLGSFTVGQEAAHHQGEGRQNGQDMRQEFARSTNIWGSRQDTPTTVERPRFSRLSFAGVDTIA
jgi:flagellar hook-length control protein FliK